MNDINDINEINQIEKINLDKKDFISSDYLSDPIISSCFSLKQRLNKKWRNILKIKKEKNFLEILDKKEKKEINQNFKGKSLSLHILETSLLDLDDFMNYPFLKIHFVDLKTGKYLQKNKLNNFYQKEKVTKNINDPNQSIIEIDSDFVFPISTKNCDLFKIRKNQAIWNEKLYMQFDPDFTYNENILILFELLDFNINLVYNNKYVSKLNKFNQYKIAWGYLRPLGVAGINENMLSIQFFDYKFRSNYYKENVKYENIPEVYFDFLWPFKSKYNGYVNLILDFIKCPKQKFVKKNPRNVFEIEIGDDEYSDKNLNLARENSEIITQNPNELKRLNFLNKIRFNSEIGSLLPNKLLKSLETDFFGSLKNKFSPSGKYLAYSVTKKNNFSYIKIYNFEDDIDFCSFYHHFNLIHDIDWHKSEKYIISSSADKTIKIFEIPQYRIYNTNDISIMQKYLIGEIIGNSFFYFAKFFYKSFEEENVDKFLFIISGNKDGFIRISKIELKTKNVISLLEINFNNSFEKSFPNSIYISDNNFYIGDSIGKIKIFSFEFIYKNLKILKTNEINLEEFKNKIINQIIYLKEENSLIIMTRDNCIRLINLKTEKIPNFYTRGRFSKENINCLLSPDNQIIVSGGENGIPKFWDFYSTNIIKSDLEYNINGCLMAVDWNKKYHVIAFSSFGSRFPVALYYYDEDLKI